MFDVGDLVGHWGYLAIFVIVVLGNVGLPIPEETALLAGGYLVWRGDLRWSLLLTVGIVSAVGGDNVGYWLGRWHGERVLEHCRRLIRLKPRRFQAMRGFIRRWGFLGVFLSRFVPGCRFLTGPLAGAVGVPFTVFLPANVTAALVYVPAVVAVGYGVGYGAGAHVERMLRALGPVEGTVLICAIALVTAAFIWRVVRAFR